MFLMVTSANRSVGAVSNTGTTTDRRPARTENRSMAASRRWYGTGLRLVLSWFADVTAHTTVARSARSLRYRAWNLVRTWWRPGNSTYVAAVNASRSARPRCPRPDRW